jgi:hypothetical protein
VSIWGDSRSSVSWSVALVRSSTFPGYAVPRVAEVPLGSDLQETGGTRNETVYVTMEIPLGSFFRFYDTTNPLKRKTNPFTLTHDQQRAAIVSLLLPQIDHSAHGLCCCVCVFVLGTR